MKKNLLVLCFMMLTGIITNQAWAQYLVAGVEVTADIQLDGMTYGEDYYVEDKATSGWLFNGTNIGNVADGGVSGWGFYLIVFNNSIPEGKTINDIKAVWNGETLSPQRLGSAKHCFEVSIVYDGVFMTEGTFTAKWNTGTDAIEGVNADSKAIYYADGVVYNNAGKIAIYSTTGKLMIATDEATVDVRDFSKGAYIVRSANKSIKFMK